jgi:hypothetical protein
MFTRVVNLLTFKLAVFQGGSGGNKDAGSIHLNPLKNSAIRCNFRTYPRLSGPIRSKSADLDHKNSNLSEARRTEIRTYPRLSGPIRSYPSPRVFFRWPAHSVGRVPSRGFSCHTVRAFPRLSAHQMIFPSIRLMSPSCRTLGVSWAGLEPGVRSRNPTADFG